MHLDSELIVFTKSSKKNHEMLMISVLRLRGVPVELLNQSVVSGRASRGSSELKCTLVFSELEVVFGI